MTLAIDALLLAAHSPVRNYVIPGLTSYLISEPGPSGTFRLFVNSRDHQESIAPHSHRFGFVCEVLRGTVRNRTWMKDSSGDLFTASTLRYRGDIGQYEKTPGETAAWSYRDRVYEAGDRYAMTASEVHSIFFSRGAVVLFFEQPSSTDTSIVLEPFVNDKTVPTGAVQPWMFQR